MPGLFAFAILATIILGTGGCASAKKAGGTVPKRDLKIERATKSVQTRYEFEWFDGKAKIDIDTEDLKVGLTATFRMQKDSMIWVALSKFGLEMARILITPDSAYVIDRLNREYYAEPVAEYLDKYHIPFGFGQLQDVILGLPVVIDGSKYKLEQLEDQWVLTALGRDGLLGRYLLEYASPVRVVECMITDPADRSFTVIYSNFTQCGNCSFDTPFNRKQVLVSEHGVQVLEMKFTEITIDKEIAAPFSVPNHYMTYD
jgi:hypothetical protein